MARLTRAGRSRGPAAGSREAGRPADVVERFLHEVISGGSLPGMDDLVDPRIRIHAAAAHDVVGIAGLKELMQALRSTFTEVQVVLDAAVVVDELVVARWGGSTWLDRHWPIPPMRIDLPQAVTVFRVMAGRVVEIWPLDPALGPESMEARVDEDEREGEDEPSDRRWSVEEDDDDGPVGGAPPGPRWVPPEPKPVPGKKPPSR